MLQQNSYFPSRYFKWLKNSKSSATYLSVLLCVLVLSMQPNKIYIVIVALCELIYKILKHRKNLKSSIKKLVYTPRVKRLIASMVIFSAILTVLAFLPFVPQAAAYSATGILIILSHFPQFLMLVAYFINMPVEKAFSNYFVNDAKRILKENKNLLVIGVTGSFGKTSVKFMLNRILSEKYNTLATPESFNTPMGIAKTVRQSLTPATEIFIAEMGAKNIGDIKELCDITNPSLGIITAVGPQHLETFKSLDNVANTKFELADACFNNNGKVYVNFDSEPAKAKAAALNLENIISYGIGDSMATAENIKMTTNGTEFDVCYNQHKFKITCKLLGRHNITNILGAVAVALDLGVDEKQIRFALSSVKAPAHRLELKSFVNGSLLIDDAYNSNPVGCIEAVNVLGSFEDKKKIIVTPGLVELGDKEYECNYNLGKASAEKCDVIILVGKKRSVPMKDAICKTDFNKENLYVADNFADAMNILREITDENSVVLFENDLPDNYAG